MIENETTKHKEIDYYWIKTKDIYSNYPTVRHRYRFVINSLKSFVKKNNFTFFDYGTGNGKLLLKVKSDFNLPDNNLGGCEISKTGFELTKSEINSTYLFNSSLPTMDKRFDVISCIEVIEHTKEYKKIIEWIKNHLSEEGILILSTQTGSIHGSDKYTGHTQHFKLDYLINVLIESGYKVIYQKQWGFPFFTIQKNLTDFNFNFTQKNFLETKPSTLKKLFYNIIYLTYYFHDLINLGPQIYIVAKKNEC